MFKRLGVLGLMLAASTAALIQPPTVFAQDRYERGNAYGNYDRNDRGQFRRDRDYDRGFQDREWRRREARERAWREREWREHDRRYDQSYGYNNYYSPNYNGGAYYGRPY